MYYIKKPIVISAEQYTGDNLERLVQWCPDLIVDTIPYIKTLEGKLMLSIDDYLIKGVQGEFYPCKPDIFKQTYSLITSTLTFSEALNAAKQGARIARKGWNGKDMFVFLVPGSTFKVNRAPLLGIYPEGTTINYHAHLNMRTADGQIVPWLASQTDILAEDWEILE